MPGRNEKKIYHNMLVDLCQMSARSFTTALMRNNGDRVGAIANVASGAVGSADVAG